MELCLLESRHQVIFYQWPQKEQKPAVAALQPQPVHELRVCCTSFPRGVILMAVEKLDWAGQTCSVPKSVRLVHSGNCLFQKNKSFNNFFFNVKCVVLVTQSCLILLDLMERGLPGSSIHGISQARILEWVAISFSRRSAQPRDWTHVSHIAGWFFTAWATRETQKQKCEVSN